jgi:hypothetical protein
MKELPKRFEFTVAGIGYTICANKKCVYVIEDPYNLLTITYSWSKAQVENLVQSGKWVITKDLSEPELKLPIIVQWVGHETQYTALAGANGKLDLVAHTDFTHYDTYTTHQLEGMIKDGTVVVIASPAVFKEPTSEDRSKLAFTVTIDTKDALDGIKDVQYALDCLQSTANRLGIKFTAKGE